MPTGDITFCIPCYNAASTIGRCVAAVLGEQRRNSDAEIVVVDNASTDGTAELARGLLKDTPQARVVVNDRNVGRIENWNRCLELSPGRWLRLATTNNVLPEGSTAALRKCVGEGDGFAYGKVTRVTELPATAPVTQEAGAQRLDRRQISFFISLADQAGGCVKFHGLTAVMDMGLKGRYALAGLNSDSYYLEGRQCALRLGTLTGSNHLAFWFLDKQYYRDCGGQPPSFAKTRQIFQGSGHFLPYVHWLLSRVREWRQNAGR